MADNKSSKKAVKKPTKRVAKKAVSNKKTTKSTSTLNKKTVNKSAVAKTAPNKVSAKKDISSVASSSKVTNKKTLATPMDKIRSLHISNVLTTFILGILTLLFVSPVVKDLLLNYQARDMFVKGDSVSLVSATQTLFTMDMRYVLVSILLLSMIGSVLMGITKYKKYEAEIQNKVSKMRWIVYGVTSAVIVEFVSVMAGVQDLVTLKLVGIMMIIGCLFAWQTEKNAAAGKSLRVSYLGYVISSVVALLPAVISLVTTSVISGYRFSWHVYGLVLVSILMIVANVLNLRSSTNGKQKYEYTTFEQRYIRIDQISKLLIVVIIFAAFNK